MTLSIHQRFCPLFYSPMIPILYYPIQSLSKKEHVIALFMDLSKAFDTIDHDILLYKLNKYGIRGIVLSWIKSYLSNRQQFVSIDKVESSLLNIKCGVPQGSILGPLLFVIYINDIVNSSTVLAFVLFADDTNLYYPTHT